MVTDQLSCHVLCPAKTGLLETRHLVHGHLELTAEDFASQERGAFEVILERIESDDKLVLPYGKNRVSKGGNAKWRVVS